MFETSDKWSTRVKLRRLKLNDIYSKGSWKIILVKLGNKSRNTQCDSQRQIGADSKQKVRAKWTLTLKFRLKFLYCIIFYSSWGSKNSLSLRYNARPRKERLDRVHTGLNWFYSQCAVMWMCCTFYRSRRINRINNVVPNNSCLHVGGETSLLKSFVVWVFLLALTLLKLFVARRPGLWLILTGRTVLCKLISGQIRATSIIHFSLRQWMSVCSPIWIKKLQY